MDTRTRARLGVAAALSLAAVALAGLALATVYGFAEEYGAGSFTDLALFVVPIPVLVVALAVAVWPRLRSRPQLVLVAGAVAVMVGGGLAAEALGEAAHHDRLVEESHTFACNGPNSEITLPAVIDQTWRELPREEPLYGPIQGGPTDCVAGVAGDGERTFADYTDAFRDLDGWTVEVDRPQRFVMVRDDVEVIVQQGPDDLTTIRVGVVSRAAAAPARGGTAGPATGRRRAPARRRCGSPRPAPVPGSPGTG